MSIKSKAKREQKKRLFHLCYNKKRHNEFPFQICNYPKCTKKSYTFKRCRDHRFYGSVCSALSRLTKAGKIERVKRGWYQAKKEPESVTFAPASEHRAM